MSSRSRLAALSSSLFVLCACGPAAPQPGPGDGGLFPGLGGGTGGIGGGGGVGGGVGGGGGGGAAALPPGTSCLQTLDCLFSCAPGDSACQDTCYNRGSDEGKAQLLAFAECVEAEQCNDAQCIEARCAVSLAACVDSSKPQTLGTPLQGSAPAGSVPADLVGVWVGARAGITQRLTLNADGTASWETTIVTQHYACVSSVAKVKTGTAVVAEKTITLYATDVVERERVCSASYTETPFAPVTEVLQWGRVATDPNTILLIDGVCAAQYPGQENCEYAGCPIGLYCTGRLTRE